MIEIGVQRTFPVEGYKRPCQAGAVSVCFERMEFQLLEAWLGMADDRWK